MKLFDYQQKLLDDDSRNIIAIWGRITGKTLMSALCALKYARKHSKSYTLILNFSECALYPTRNYIQENLERSFGFSDRIKEWFRKWILRRHIYVTRSFIQLRNGSIISLYSAASKGVIGQNPNKLIIDNFECLCKAMLEVVNTLMANCPDTVIFATPTDNKKEILTLMKTPSYNIHHAPTELNPLVDRSFLKEEIELARYKQEYEAVFVTDEQ